MTTTKTPVKVPAGKSKTPVKEPAPQQEEITPKVVSAGRWDALAYWAVIILMDADKSLVEKGVTSLQVGQFFLDMTAQVFKDLEGVQAIPQGVTLKDIKALPLKGEGGWTRKLDNTLWRMCPSTPGDRQAGGGKYPTSKLLVRNSTSRPVTFTLDS